MRALIIEDQFFVATLIETHLRDLGYTDFRFANSEETAVEAATRECPDLITADDRLESGVGVNAVRRICADRPIPVVFIVGSPSDVRAAIPDAVILEKPFTSSAFAQAVEAALALSSQSLMERRKGAPAK